MASPELRPGRARPLHGTLRRRPAGLEGAGRAAGGGRNSRDPRRTHPHSRAFSDRAPISLILRDSVQGPFPTTDSDHSKKCLAKLDTYSSIATSVGTTTGGGSAHWPRPRQDGPRRGVQAVEPPASSELADDGGVHLVPRCSTTPRTRSARRTLRRRWRAARRPPRRCGRSGARRTRGSPPRRRRRRLPSDRAPGPRPDGPRSGPVSRNAAHLTGRSAAAGSARPWSGRARRLFALVATRWAAPALS